MGKKVVVFLAAVLLLTFCSAAQAIDWSDNFEDGSMGSMWSKWSDGDGNDSYLTEPGGIDGALNWTPLWVEGATEQYEAYSLDYDIDFTEDFGFRVDFSNTYLGDTWSGLGVDISLNSSDDSLYVSIGAEYIGSDNWLDEMGSMDGYGTGKMFFSSVEFGPGDDDEIFSAEDRTINSGWLGIRYFAEDDLLEVGAFSSLDDSVQVAGMQYEDFTYTYEPGLMSLSIGGWFEGDDMLSGGAYLDNFSGTVTPEPVSSILFLVGGASLAAAKMRRKKKS